MAHGDDPASATTSFFIVTGDARSLDGKYTAFGRVVDGMAVVDAIEQTPVNGEAPVSRDRAEAGQGGEVSDRQRRQIANPAAPRRLSSNFGHWHIIATNRNARKRHSTSPRGVNNPCEDCRQTIVTLVHHRPRWSSNGGGADDWPQWRGPNRDGVSTETGC